MRGAIAVVAGFAAGSLPFSHWAAKQKAGVDLRQVGSGTVSGTGLARVAGARVLVAVGLLELAKGAAGPLLAGRRRPVARALSGMAAVAGHNWSPWLGGAGGRGISPAMGSLLVNAPAGAGALLGGLAVGRLLGETALGSLVADLVLVPVSARYHGRPGRWAATAVLVPMLVKRLAGNGPPQAPTLKVYLYRLLVDRDDRVKTGSPEASGRSGEVPH